MPTSNNKHPKNLFSQIGIAFFLSAVTTFLVSCGGSGQKADPNFRVAISHPAYVDTHPKVLFDEAHKNFHTSTGRYKPFAQLLLADGYQVKPNKEKFSQESLNGYDILVISNAKGMKVKYEPAFTEQECEAVRDWVNSGGSLLLIADHYPMGSAAKNLSEQFGVNMSCGETADSAHYDTTSSDKAQLIFSRDNGLLAAYTITEGRDSNERINRVITFTGQSLKGPPGSFALLPLGETATEIIPDSIWVKKSMLFFATTHTRFSEPVSAAGRTQGVALTYGEGRVVVLGEAAMLTAQIDDMTGKPFGMNVPGIDNRQFTLNIMHWLSGLLN